MVSSRWVYALILGGFGGILVFALMAMAQREEEEQRAARAEKTVELQLVGLPELDPHWGTIRSRKPAGKLASEPKRGARIAA